MVIEVVSLIASSLVFWVEPRMFGQQKNTLLFLTKRPLLHERVMFFFIFFFEARSIILS